MNDMSIRTTKIGEEILTYEVSDETSAAAEMDKDRAGNYTLAYCAGLSICPT